MQVIDLQCFIFTLTVITLGVKGEDLIKPHRKFVSSQISPETNIGLLHCLADLFSSLFNLPSEDDSEEGEAVIMTKKLYENSQCVAQLIKYDKELVQYLGTFFDSLFPCYLKNLQGQCEDKNKEKLKIYQNAICIGDKIFKDKNLYSRLREIITTFLEKMEVPQPCSPDDIEVSQFLSRNLLECLVYHFRATFEFSVPDGVKQKEKILKRNLFWNSGFIAITAERSKTMFIYLAKLFNVILNFSSPNATKTNRNKQNIEFYKIIDHITGELGNEVSANATFNGSRIIFEFVERIENPEPKDPDVTITYTMFDHIPVIIQEPRTFSSSLKPGLVFFHGGAWIYRHPDRYLPETVYLAKHSGAVVVSVDYRRSPEYRYPIPLNDCLNATKYFMKNARRFNVDAQRIGIIGDSAGGNMAASVSLLMRDYKLKKPKLQVLIYPCIQMFNFDLPSYQENKMMFGLDNKILLIEFCLTYTNLNLSFEDEIYNNKHICKDMKTSIYNSYFDFDAIPDEYLKNYTRNKTVCDPILAETVKETILNPYIFPFMAKSLKNLPPTLIINAEFDILRDEGLMYGYRLRKANVPLEEHLIKGGYHDMLIMLDLKTSDVGKEVMGILVNYLKHNL